MNPKYLQTMYKNDEDRQLVRILFILIWAMLGTYLFVLFAGLIYKDTRLTAVTMAGCAFLIVPVALLRSGRLRTSSLAVVLSTLIMVTFFATVGQGIHDLAIIGFPIIFIFAGLTMDRVLFRLSVGFAMLSACWLSVGEYMGWFVTHPLVGENINWMYLIMVLILFAVAAVAVDLLTANMRRNLGLAQREISQRKQADEALQTSEAHYRFLVNNTSDDIVGLDPDCRVVFTNDNTKLFHGYERDEILNTYAWEHIHLDDHVKITECLIKIIETGVPGRAEYRLNRKDGTYMWVEATGNRVINKLGKPEAIFVQRDITERKGAEDQLRFQGTHDSLTGIYNRTYFETELARLEHSRDFPISIVIADVDKLKIVNDTQGHAVGDELLRQVANVLGSVFRAGDIVARIGGDEFAALLPATNAAAAEKLLARVKKRVDMHNAEHPELQLQLSLGTAIAEKGSLLPDTFCLADQRMYADKAVHKLNAKTL